MSKTSLTKLALGALLSGAVGLGCSNAPDVRQASTSHSAVAVQPGTAPLPAGQPTQPQTATQPQAVAQALARDASRPAPVSAQPASTTSMKAPMNLFYSRTGGIAGFQDEVRVSGDMLKVTRRGKTTMERKLTAEELTRLKGLAEKAAAAPTPVASKHRPVPDAFNISVGMGGQRVTISEPPEHLNPAWEELAQALRGLMTAVR
jgi:hypothetical protein